MADNALMAKKKNQQKPLASTEPQKINREKYRKPRRLVGIKGVFIKAAEPMLKKTAEELTTVVNRAFRIYLENEGFWPPAEDTPES